VFSSCFYLNLIHLPISFCLATGERSGRRLYLAAAEAGTQGEVERLAWMELMGAAISIARCVFGGFCVCLFGWEVTHIHTTPPPPYHHGRETAAYEADQRLLLDGTGYGAGSPSSSSQRSPSVVLQRRLPAWRVFESVEAAEQKVCGHTHTHTHIHIQRERER
jgi:hypothetical protein